MQLWIPHTREGIAVIFGICEDTNKVCTQILSICVAETKEALRRYLSLSSKLRKQQNLIQLDRTQALEVTQRADTASISSMAMDENSSVQEETLPTQLGSANWTVLPQVDTLLAEETLLPGQEPEEDEAKEEDNELEALSKKLLDAKKDWQLCTVRILYLIGEIALRLLVISEMKIPKEMRKYMPHIKDLNSMKPEERKR